MAADSELFRPLQLCAREELATQINASKPNAAKLSALGFSWDIAFAIQRQVQEGAGNASMLRGCGLSPTLAKAIADAIDAVAAARLARVADEPEPKARQRAPALFDRYHQRRRDPLRPSYSERWW